MSKELDCDRPLSGLEVGRLNLAGPRRVGSPVLRFWPHDEDGVVNECLSHRASVVQRRPRRRQPLRIGSSLRRLGRSGLAPDRERHLCGRRWFTAMGTLAPACLAADATRDVDGVLQDRVHRRTGPNSY